MQVKLEFAIYNEAQNKFELDNNVYNFELTQEQEQTFNILKDNDLHLYNWFAESDYFIEWVKTEVYPGSIGKKIAICDINDISFRRYYFFKVTSSDTHYDYFKKLFDIHHEVDWQDREEVGEDILQRLILKRQELIIELKEDVVVEDEDVKSQINASDSEE